MSYTHPENDEDTLHIDAEYGISFGTLAEKILEHFGAIQLDELEITTRKIKTDGCGCHSEPADYTAYMVITKRSNPCPYTVTHQPNIVIHDDTLAIG